MVGIGVGHDSHVGVQRQESCGRTRLLPGRIGRCRQQRVLPRFTAIPQKRAYVEDRLVQ
jgi:hypothetical protein